MQHKYIAIEGNIGVGKTTLAEILSKEMSAELVLEKFMDNDFLPLFYNDMNKYGIHVELSFLIDRLEDIDSYSHTDLVVSDYFFPKTLLFAKNNLDQHALKIFERVYSKFEEKSRKPDLIIYLKRDLDELENNIKKRGRPMENKITREYLTTIQEAYDQYFSGNHRHKVLVLDVGEIDFTQNSEKVKEVGTLINKDYSEGVTMIKLN
jgi:deoxyadenosine/deoxycytidine kinase